MKPNNEHLAYCSSFSGNLVLWEIDNQNKPLCYSLWGVLLLQKYDKYHCLSLWRYPPLTQATTDGRQAQNEPPVCHTTDFWTMPLLESQKYQATDGALKIIARAICFISPQSLFLQLCNNICKSVTEIYNSYSSLSQNLQDCNHNNKILIIHIIVSWACNTSSDQRWAGQCKSMYQTYWSLRRAQNNIFYWWNMLMETPKLLREEKVLQGLASS